MYKLSLTFYQFKLQKRSSQKESKEESFWKTLRTGILHGDDFYRLYLRMYDAHNLRQRLQQKTNKLTYLSNHHAFWTALELEMFRGICLQLSSKHNPPCWFLLCVVRISRDSCKTRQGANHIAQPERGHERSFKIWRPPFLLFCTEEIFTGKLFPL